MPGFEPSERIDRLLTALEGGTVPCDREAMVANLRRLREELRADEEERRRADDRLRHAIEAAQVGVWDWDLVADRVVWNEHTARICGVPLETFDGTVAGFYRCVHPDDREQLISWVERARSAAMHFDHVFRLVWPDGAERWVRANGGFAGDAGGRAVRMIGTLVDITDQTRGRRLADSERRYRTLVEHADALIARFDRKGRHLLVNAAVEAATGLRREQMLGRTNRELGMEQSLCELWDARLEEVFATGRPVEVAFDAASASGLRHYKSRLVPERGDDGEVESVISIVHDVTEGRSAIEALNQNLALLRAISNSTDDAIYAKDTAGRLTFANPATLALVGRPSAAVLGRTDAELLDDKEAARRIMRNDRRIIEGGGAEDLEEILAPPDGTERVWFSRKVAFRDAAGRVVGLVGISRDITERKRAEEDLRSQRELLGGIIDTIPVMLAIYDPRLRTFRFNRELRDVLGWTEADAADGGFMEKAYPDPEYRKGVVAYMQSLATGWRDFEVTAKDGSIVTSSWANVRLSDATHIGIGIDVRARRAAELAVERSREAMRRSERRYRSFIEAMAQVVWTSNPRGEVDAEMPGWQAYTGHSASQASGFGWLDAVHPEDREKTAAAWQKAFESGGVFETEYRLRRHDGVWRSILARGVPVQDDDGQVAEYVGVCIDVTDREEAEAARREVETRLRLTTDALPVLISYVDTKLCYRFTNAAYREWFGFKPENGRPVREVLGDETYAVRLPHIARALAGEHVVFEDTMMHVQKGERVTETSYVPDLAYDGRTVRGFIALVYDITERRQTEEALRRAKQEAEQANSAKDHFLAVLSHELRTPLTPVLATAEMLEEDPALAPEHREMAQLMRRNVELEARLIDDLLDLTRVARNKLELHLTTFDAHEKIREVLRMCGEEIAARRLVLNTEFTASGSFIQGDTARFQQIVWNLLKNAVKFTPAQGCITVRTTMPASGSLAIEVEDTGVGIGSEALPRIFDAFEQGGREVTRKYGGLGLGLAISKALVELHGGTISAASEGKGKGARFTVILPVVPAAKSGPRPGGGEAPMHLPRAVLLVDDHADTRQVLERMLVRFGCRVSSAGSVAEALQLAETQAFDLLVSDLGLPDGCGTGIMAQLARRGPIRGIALSGFGTEQDIARSRQAGFDLHLTKPVNREELEQAVRRLTA